MAVWMLRHRAEAPPAQAAPAKAVVPVPALPVRGGIAPSSLSNDEAKALCSAMVPADSPVRAALLGSMGKARALPARADVWVDVARAWMQQLRRTGDAGFALNAEACARVSQIIAPDHPPALGVIAAVRLNAHEFAAAREIAEALLARDPTDQVALGVLSDAALELGDVTAASDAAQRLIDLAPGLGAYSRASYLRWLHGDEAAAIELGRLAIDAAGDPNDLTARAWALVQAANLFWQRGDHEGAEAGYRMALNVQSDYAPALLALGKLQAAHSRAREAADSLSRAFAAHADVETAGLLGDLVQLLGDAPGAARYAAQVEQLGRHDRRALALYYADHHEQSARAIELASEELAVRGDIYTEDTLAWALYAGGRFAEAEAHAERALRLGTRDALLLYHLGAIRLALGKPGEAKALIEQALGQNAQFSWRGALAARELLARMGS